MFLAKSATPFRRIFSRILSLTAKFPRAEKIKPAIYY